METDPENPGPPPNEAADAPLPGAKAPKPRSAGKRPRKKLLKPRDGEALVVPRLKLSSGKSVKVAENTKRKKEVIAEWVALRSVNPKISVREGAERLHITPFTLWHYIRQGTKEGWLQFDDPMERLEHEIIPGVVDNLAGFIAAKDRTVTIETAKGTIFKTYQEKMGVADATQRPTLTLNIEISNPSPDPTPVNVIEGHLIGKPKELSETTEN